MFYISYTIGILKTGFENGPIFFTSYYLLLFLVMIKGNNSHYKGVR